MVVKEGMTNPESLADRREDSNESFIFTFIESCLEGSEDLFWYATV